MFNSLQSDPRNASYEGKDQDERIKYVIRESVYNTLPWIAMTVILAIIPTLAAQPILSFHKADPSILSSTSLFLITALWYMFTFGFFFQNLLNWFFNVLIITNKKIVDVDFVGFLYKNISETTLEHIEDVTSNVSGALGVTFNVGSVYIQTAGEKREFEFNGVDNPSAIRDLLSDLVAVVKNHGNNN